MSQEPILFDKTIRENIVYGIQDSDKVSYQQIVEASEQANIHSVKKILHLSTLYVLLGHSWASRWFPPSFFRFL